MKFIKKYWLYLLIIFLSIFVRFYKLDQIPSALYYDEIDLGYQIRSLQETGKDYRGTQNPFFFRSFNTDKTPLPIYFSALISGIFKTPEYQVRSGTALAGVLVVILAMVITYQVTRSKIASVIAGFVFALSPWQIHFSRLAFEAEFALLSLFTFLAFLNHWLMTKSRLGYWGSAIFLGLSVYTYRTMSFLAPSLLVITIIYFYHQFQKEGTKLLFGWIALVLAISSPFIYVTTVGAKDQTRISQISIFSDPMTPIEIQRSRELESGDFQNPGVGRQASLSSKIFHNKPLSYIEKFSQNTINNFSVNFLFISGDPNGRHSTKNSGELLFVDVVGLGLGVFYLFKKIRDRKYSFLLVVLLLSAVPSNLTLDGSNHASRLITFSGPLLVLVSLGYFYLYEVIVKFKYRKFIFSFFFLIWLFFVTQFINKYFLRFPIENSREFGYGYKQAVQKIVSHKNDFKNIYLTGINDPPMLYFLYWANVPPKMVQEYGTEYNLSTKKGLPLDQVKPFYPDDLICKEHYIKQLNADTIYMVAYRNLPMDFRSSDKDKVPQGIKLLDVVKYPDNEVAYYLITRDLDKLGKPILPIKGQSCK